MHTSSSFESDGPSNGVAGSGVNKRLKGSRVYGWFEGGRGVLITVEDCDCGDAFSLACSVFQKGMRLLWGGLAGFRRSLTDMASRSTRSELETPPNVMFDQGSFHRSPSSRTLESSIDLPFSPGSLFPSPVFLAFLLLAERARPAV